MERDLAGVAAGITRWLTARRGVGDLTLTRCDRPTGGLSSETLMVDAVGRDYSESLVVRLAPSDAGIFPEYDLAVQARAQEAAAANGIPVAAPVELETDLQWLGAPFMAMPAIAGTVPGAMPLRDPWITESEPAAAQVCRSLYDTLAAIHRVDWQGSGLDHALPVRDLDAELAYWTRYLDWYADGAVAAPALSDALAWCTSTRPDDPPHSFLWGDVRLGNVIFDANRRPAAVLDWEMTTIGAAEHDVAWYLTLEATQNELFGRSVPGFLDHDAACAYYEARVGRPLQALEWFEVFAMVRSTAIMTRLAYRQEQAGQPPLLPLAENPILDQLTRRVAEASRA